MSVIERYRIEQRMDTETIPVRDNHERRLIARCDSIEDARLVVAALNTHAGAVEALREVCDQLGGERITQTRAFAAYDAAAKALAAPGGAVRR